MNTKEQFEQPLAPPTKINLFALRYDKYGEYTDWEVVRSVKIGKDTYIWRTIGDFETYTMARIFLRAVRRRNKGKQWDRRYRKLYPADCVVRTNNLKLMGDA